MKEPKKYPNKLGVWGWIGGGRWGIERYLYTLHRISGLVILAYFLLHIFVTSSRALGRQGWEASMNAVSSPIFGWGELLVFFAFAVHALNGVRLIIIELGVAVGKPEDPVYPYRSSLNTQRPLMVGVMLVAAAIIVAGGYDFLITRH